MGLVSRLAYLEGGQLLVQAPKDHRGDVQGPGGKDGLTLSQDEGQVALACQSGDDFGQRALNRAHGFALDTLQFLLSYLQQTLDVLDALAEFAPFLGVGVGRKDGALSLELLGGEAKRVFLFLYFGLDRVRNFSIWARTSLTTAVWLRIASTSMMANLTGDGPAAGAGAVFS